MSESQIERASSGAVADAEPYPSFAALRDAHRDLLKADREMTDRPAFLDRVEQFCERAYATGALLDVPEDRRAGQSLLNYWVTTLYGDERTPPNTILADFDISVIPRLDDAACPYPGSRAFTEDDAKNFFGRDKQTDYVLNRLIVDRMFALIGPSGRGKTSMALAGILPALRVSDNLSGLRRLYFSVLTPGSNPLGSLAGMIKAARNDSSEAAADSSKSFLRNSNYLIEAIKKISDLPVVIVVDQFDDLFTLCDDRKQQQAFLENLLKVVQAPEPKHTVIFTMRSDSYDDRIKKLSAEFSELFKPVKWTLPPLGANEIGDAIRKPADKVGLKISEPVVLALIKEILSEPIGLPLLQFALQKLWAKRELNAVPEKVLKDLGGCRTAFVHAADELYKALEPEEKSTARNILMKLIKVDDDNNQVTVIPVLRADLFKGDQRERVESVLQRLVGSGLVRLTENKEQDVQVELVHDSLIRSWNEMAAWVGGTKSRRQVIKYTVRAVMVLMFLAGAVVLLEAFVRSGEDKRRNLSHFFANRSNELLKTRNVSLKTRDQNLALLFAVHAYRLLDDAETRGSVLNALWQTPRPVRFLFKTRSITGALALSPDKKHLATFDDKGRVSIWDLDSKQSVETKLPPSVSASYPLVFSPDGKTLAWTSSIRNEHDEPVADPQSNITLWDLGTSTATPLFVDEKYRVESIAFSSKSDVLIAGGTDGRVFRWDLAKKSLDQQPLITLSGSVRSISLDSHGNWLACGDSDGRVVLWDLNKRQRDPLLDKPGKSKQQVQQVGRADDISSVSFSPDGRLLAIDRIKGTTVWDLSRKSEIANIPNQLLDLKRFSAFSEDGQTLTSYNADGTLIVWDLLNNRRLGAHLYASVDASEAIAFSSDGKILASPRDDGITLWDIDSHRPQIVSSQIGAVAFAPSSNNTILAAASTDGRIILWDTVNRRQIGEMSQRSEQNETVTVLAFSPDGKTLAAGSLNTVMFWDVTRGSLIGEPAKLEGSVLSLVFRSNGPTLAATVADDMHTLALWNVTERKRVGSLPKQNVTVNSASFDPSGNELATAYSDGTVRIWNVTTPGDLTSENPVHYAAVLPGGTISRIAFSPDGSALAFLINPDDSAAGLGSSKGILMWDIKSNTQVADEFTGHGYSVLSIAFRSDGKVLASSGADETVILWDMDAESAKDQFCRIANTNLSKKDWNTYIGEGEEYCSICADFAPGKDAPQHAKDCKYTRWWSLW